MSRRGDNRIRRIEILGDFHGILAGTAVVCIGYGDEVQAGLVHRGRERIRSRDDIAGIGRPLYGKSLSGISRTLQRDSRGITIQDESRACIRKRHALVGIDRHAGLRGTAVGIIRHYQCVGSGCIYDRVQGIFAADDAAVLGSPLVTKILSLRGAASIDYYGWRLTSD